MCFPYDKDKVQLPGLQSIWRIEIREPKLSKKKDYSPTHVLEQEQKGVCPEQSQSSIQQFGIGSQYGGLPVLQVPHAPQSELSLHPKLPLY